MNWLGKSDASVTGFTAVVADSPTIQPGAHFNYTDSACNISGTIVRCRKRRDGTVKVWVEDMEIVLL